MAADRQQSMQIITKIGQNVMGTADKQNSDNGGILMKTRERMTANQQITDGTPKVYCRQCNA